MLSRCVCNWKFFAMSLLLCQCYISLYSQIHLTFVCYVNIWIIRTCLSYLPLQYSVSSFHGIPNRNMMWSYRTPSTTHFISLGIGWLSYELRFCYSKVDRTPPTFTRHTTRNQIFFERVSLVGMKFALYFTMSTKFEPLAWSKNSFRWLMGTGDASYFTWLIYATVAYWRAYIRVCQALGSKRTSCFNGSNQSTRVLRIT